MIANPYVHELAKPSHMNICIERWSEAIEVAGKVFWIVANSAISVMLSAADIVRCRMFLDQADTQLIDGITS